MTGSGRLQDSSWIDGAIEFFERHSRLSIWGGLIGGAALYLGFSAIQWAGRAYPAGTFNLFHLVYVLELPYLLGMMWYLKTSADQSFERFRPALQAEEHEAEELKRQLTRAPARRTLIASVAGIVIIGLQITMSFAFVLVFGADPARLFSAANTSASIAALAILGIIRWFFYGGIAYFIFHQLSTVSLIYGQWTRLDLLDTQPLHAFSAHTFRTALAVIAIPYAWYVSATEMSGSEIAVAISLFFTASALLIFVLPLQGIHRLLETEKSRELSVISSKLGMLREQLDEMTDAGDYSGVDGVDRAISSYARLRDEVAQVPTWPWRPGAFRNLLGALSIPLIVWLLQQVLDRLLLQ